MVTLRLSPFRGNQRRAYFPTWGHLGLTPVIVQGVVETEIEEDGAVLEAKSLVVSVVCQEELLGLGPGSPERGKPNELLRVSHTLWSTSSDDTYDALGTFRSPFRLRIEPEMAALFSSCVLKNYRLVWSVEARVVHKPSGVFGSTLVASQPILLQRYYPRNAAVPAPSTGLPGMLSLPVALPKHITSAFTGPGLAVPYTALLNSPSFGPDDPIRLTVTLSSDPVVVKKVSVSVTRRVTLVGKAPIDFPVATFEAFSSSTSATTEGSDKTLSVSGTFPRTKSTHVYSIGETSATPLCQMAFFFTLKAVVSVAGGSDITLVDSTPHPLFVTATTHAETLSALSSFDKALGKSDAEFRIHAYPIFNENGLSHVISNSLSPSAKSASTPSLLLATSPPSSASLRDSSRKRSTSRPREVTGKERISRSSSSSSGSSSSGSPPREPRETLDVPAVPPIPSPSFVTKALRTGGTSTGFSSSNLSSAIRPTSAKIEPTHATATELPRRGASRARPSTSSGIARPFGAPRSVSSSVTFTTAPPAPEPFVLPFSVASSSTLSSPYDSSGHLKRPHTSSGLPGPRAFSFGGGGGGSAGAGVFGGATNSNANPFRHRAPLPPPQLPSELPPTPQSAFLQTHATGSDEESTSVEASSGSQSSSSRYLSTPPRTPGDAKPDWATKATPGSSLNLIFLSIDDAGHRSEPSDVSSTVSSASNGSDSTIKPAAVKVVSSPFYYDNDDTLRRVKDVYNGHHSPKTTTSASPSRSVAATPNAPTALGAVASNSSLSLSESLRTSPPIREPLRSHQTLQDVGNHPPGPHRATQTLYSVPDTSPPPPPYSSTVHNPLMVSHSALSLQQQKAAQKPPPPRNINNGAFRKSRAARENNQVRSQQQQQQHVVSKTILAVSNSSGSWSDASVASAAPPPAKKKGLFFKRH